MKQHSLISPYPGVSYVLSCCGAAICGFACTKNEVFQVGVHKNVLREKLLCSELLWFGFQVVVVGGVLQFVSKWEENLLWESSPHFTETGCTVATGRSPYHCETIITCNLSCCP